MELEITELRLGPPGSEKKRVLEEVSDEEDGGRKSQAVGWPPVCSYRRKNSFNEKEKKMYVKVSMDGAPFLRKVDLGMHKDYSQLAFMLENLFHHSSILISEGVKDGGEKGRSEYVVIYEDKDGDWMLAGDVPWEMFAESCKRLRIAKRANAKGFGFESKDAMKKSSNN